MKPISPPARSAASDDGSTLPERGGDSALTLQCADDQRRSTAPPDEYDPKQSSRFTLVPDGVYELASLSCWDGTPYGRPTTIIEFKIMSGPEGADDESLKGCLLRYYVPGLAETEHNSTRSKRAKDFRLIMELPPPRNLYRIPAADIYSGCIFEARVGEVEKDEDGASIPPGARHSVVRKILRLLEGEPPYLARLRKQSDA